MNRQVVEAPFFSLDNGSGVPIYRQVIHQIEQGILSGRLNKGDKLPTIRAMSVELKVHPNTIDRAYKELVIKGILTQQVGAGTFISDKAPEKEDMRDVRNSKIVASCSRFIRDMIELGVEPKKIAGLVKECIGRGAAGGKV